MKYDITMATVNDLDEMELLYDELNDYLQTLEVNYPGYLKGIYPTREAAEWGLNEKGLFVLRVDGIIAGSVILSRYTPKAYSQVTWGVDVDNSEYLVIFTLVVHPAYMKQGIATRLLEFSKEYAISQNAKTLRLDVAVQNAPAIALYEKCGYKYTGTVDLETGYEHLIWFRLYELLI